MSSWNRTCHGCHGCHGCHLPKFTTARSALHVLQPLLCFGALGLDAEPPGLGYQRARDALGPRKTFSTTKRLSGDSSGDSRRTFGAWPVDTGGLIEDLKTSEQGKGEQTEREGCGHQREVEPLEDTETLNKMRHEDINVSPSFHGASGGMRARSRKRTRCSRASQTQKARDQPFCRTSEATCS